ncbi:hypothetical protein [Blastochloris viridis]|uniref:Uncharacterized protein n=1 Tax=Blastochloris viridis TaxID=1079 RepID=A0A0H5BNC2_BLAVI|nr:hypothetical protein [Blastochloris viridis]ALK08925.1 hypothetical protein BVIR_1136 [Blastochloris viridis]BAR97678.1 hypothetical protein BV133_85 [Blastochloris viridis]CUU41585.1 hypothetical protein BVIRIDIS_05780 [Blastochloris viridis]
MADHGSSERRACRRIGVNRSAWQYEPLRGQDDGVRARMAIPQEPSQRLPLDVEVGLAGRGAASGSGF